MSEVLVGSTLLADNYFGEQFEISAYENGASAHVFVSLRDDEAKDVELNIDALLGCGVELPEGYILTATLVSIDASRSDGWHFVQGAGMDAIEIR
ncbi:hypothetical protein DS901_15435 [Loktanella sp. D2R18]|jgi:hypothetical protein|uniref:hypothetical protein n=1 Tax=Rhodobacterales TaxID=204455 RepID=UPI000DE990CB|nr:MULTISPECIES: hypothetical protein [Rhodobacterales]MDO6588638.1 hypothetical protein [Yoonia sp. 1_MG-2023]RBW42111.1 hypothetical protein DS901_15435 [Loktanella sp. D2R18]